MIEVRGVSRKFEKVEALKEIDLTIDKGELFALIGPDGAGKSTLFRIVAGLLKPTKGTVRIAENVAFGFVPQRFSLYEDLSIDENLSLRARLYEIPDDVAAKRAKDLLARVGLDRFGKRLAGALSGGMRQKLSLVSEYQRRPDVPIRFFAFHRKEGDASNAGYWYRRAGQPHSQATLEAEWRAIVEALIAA